MTKKEYPLTKAEFDAIYSKVPRLTVEIIVKTEKGVLLTFRTIEPCAGLWHIPGGTIYYGELLNDAVKRIARKELSIVPTKHESIGMIEYPDHIASGYGDPRGIAVLVTEYDGDIEIDEEAEDYRWFTKVSEDIHANQDTFLVEKQLLEQ